MSPAPIALSLGEPAGIGPEIAVKAWRALERTGPVFLVVGDAESLRAAGATIHPLREPAKAAAEFENALPVLDIPLASPAVAGRPDSAAAGQVIRWIEVGAELARSGAASALVTGPIAKASLYAAGFAFPGHTELLCELAPAPAGEAARGPVMMLAAADLRVSLVTIHEPLARVAGLLSVETIVNAGLVTARALSRDFGIADPRLAVAGFNPHAGESGSLGGEEIAIVAPAVAALREAGVRATGPHPADTLF
ncbi:MAG: 4-hydroxythreonine-4-phosphate dehydrogenase PdxA, partial [Caulobacteraceae bacterium]